MVCGASGSLPPELNPRDPLFQKRRFAAFIGNNAFAAFVGGRTFSRPDGSAKT
jgi:hypothetical protein